MFGFLTRSKKKKKKSKNTNEQLISNNNFIIEKKSLIVEDKFGIKDNKNLTQETKIFRENIDELTHLTRRLTIMSEEMNTELDVQNKFLGKVTDKMDDTNYKVKRLNKTIRRI